ncbi:nickel-dependent hydrogenase large subunit [Oricola thermophila]|uniref:Nickel-dependent hydrogenase large subunit n=1 Tax=Oricola thermophila TaxID=2742145 RepID=A0A6N1V9C4_9HYPH|nr:nickel-dependent hydrogenase large subunit [Oricola thermophila]QKV17328.1 nickel-dependent hydrogenase large subunit [Oricola thermophila]
MTRLVVGPFNRVEGDLEVKLEIGDGRVEKAHVVSPLYRGFERILLGKPPADALVYAPRICGICSVSQSVAAAKALAQAQGLAMPPNGELAVNLVHATENIADHLTHFYLFFMPDFARETYSRESWFAAARERFTAIKGTAAEDMLPARAQFMHLMGLLAGKWPHTLSIQPGGSTRAVTNGEIARMSAILSAFRRFLERTLYGDTLERIASLSSVAELEGWAAEKAPESSDFRHFLSISRHLDLRRLGPSAGLFMSFGAYTVDGATLFPRGVHDNGHLALDINAIAEDVSHAMYRSGADALKPFDGETVPDIDREGAYSWCKAPRLNGKIAEVGALARQLVSGHPLVLDLVSKDGGNVHARVVARLLEVALVTMAMEGWVNALRSGERFIRHADMPDSAEGAGLAEAARGSLGHWIRIEGGRIANYQIIAPTTWNFSPRDADGTPGPLEQALEGAPVRSGETEPVAVQHIVRSFDPCLVCTVH